MRPSRLILSVIAIGIVAGCASTNVTERNPRAATETIVPPETIFVYPFAANQADVPSWTAAAILYAAPDQPRPADEIAAGRRLGELVAEQLVARINKMGLVASLATAATTPIVDDLIITGYFEAVEQGSTAKRVLIGFGSGATEMKTVVEGYRMTSLGPRLVGSGTVESSGSKTPVAIAPLVVLAATANPIGLIASGTAKVAGEVMGKNTLENAAERTVDEIADELRVRFLERGWIG